MTSRPLLRDLAEDSESYRSEAEIYDLFSRREDADGVVLRRLLPLAAGVRVLDAGCGAGKYAAALAGVALAVDAQDRADGQLAIARTRCAAHPNVRVLRGDICETLPEGRFGLILCAWVLGTLRDDGRRQAALDLLASRLAPDGRLVLVENDEGGEFERLRGRVGDPERRTARYNAWLEARGFAAVLRATTRFAFRDVAEARLAFGRIWGEAVGADVRDAEIGHRVVVFERGA